MLPLSPTTLSRPRTAADAVAAWRPGARFVAGGTDLLPNMKYGLVEPTQLVLLSGLPAPRIQRDGAGWSLDAGVTLTQIRRHPALAATYPALAQACATVATPTLQNMATLGGNVLLDTRCRFYNQSRFWRSALDPGRDGCLKCDSAGLCHVAPKSPVCLAAHSADTVPVLWLLGARLVVLGPQGERVVAIQDVVGGQDGRAPNRLAPGELLVRVLLPPPKDPIAHRKLRIRGAIDYPLLLTAVTGGPGDFQAVLSAVGPSPVHVRVDSAEALIEAGWRAARPLNTHVVATTWRKKMVRVELQRAVDYLAAAD
jgi:4-hydroxybenzoyl-CoA reductase subunit beta